jgi:hypothetical protein
MANVLDQSQTSDNNTITLRYTDSVNDEIGEQFVPSITAKCSRIILKLLNPTGPTGHVWIEIYADAAGLPGALLATSDKLNCTSVPGSASEVSFDFTATNLVLLTSGTIYHFALVGDYAYSNTVVIQARNTYPTDTYPNGTLEILNGSTWVDSDGDLYFKEYYDDTTIPSAPSTPSTPEVIAPMPPSASVYTDNYLSVEHYGPLSTNAKKLGYTVDTGLLNVPVNVQPASKEVLAVTGGAYGKAYIIYTTASGILEGDRLTLSGMLTKTYTVKGRENFNYGPAQHLELYVEKEV